MGARDDGGGPLIEAEKPRLGVRVAEVSRVRGYCGSAGEREVEWNEWVRGNGNIFWFCERIFWAGEYGVESWELFEWARLLAGDGTA